MLFHQKHEDTLFKWKIHLIPFSIIMWKYRTVISSMKSQRIINNAITQNNSLTNGVLAWYSDLKTFKKSWILFLYLQEQQQSILTKNGWWIYMMNNLVLGHDTPKILRLTYLTLDLKLTRPLDGQFSIINCKL